MAVIVAGTNGILTDDLVAFHSMLSSTALGAPSATQFRSSDQSLREWTFTGTGFGNVQNGFPTTGTITGIQIKVAGQVVITISGLSLAVQDFFSMIATASPLTFSQALLTGDDNIVGAQHAANIMHGYEGNDTLNGGALNDQLFGEGGSNVLNGGGGDDIITSAGSGDIISGGAEQDTLRMDRSNASSSLIVTFGAGGVVTSSDGTQASSIESFSLALGSGNDSFELLDVNAGAISALDGGAGTDRVIANFSALAGGVQLIDGSLVTTAGNTSIAGVEEFDIRGGVASNVLHGGQGSDRFIGNAGNDQLTGNEGDDILDGASGDLDGASGDDVLNGGAGADTMTGGDGNDIAYSSGADAIDGGTGNADLLDIRFNGLTPVTFTNGGLASSEGAVLNNGTIARNIEGVRLGTGDGNDTFIVTETLAQGSEFSGGGGIDTLIVDLAGSTAPVAFGQGFSSATLSIGGVDTLLSSVEVFRIGGGDGADQMSGYDSEDFFRGRGGNDELSGGGGNDVLDGGDGDDRLIGGAGIDTASYASATSGINLNLNIGIFAGGQPPIDTGSAGRDYFESIENFEGSAFDDRIIGDVSSNVLLGNEGNDFLNGINGNDTVWGGGGDDRLRGGPGDDFLYGEAGDDNFAIDDFEHGVDVINGGEGSDTIECSFSPFATPIPRDVVLDLATGSHVFQSVVTLTFQSIENVLGAGGNDVFSGTEADNFLAGNDGADTLRGRGGDDVLSGGNQSDVLDGGAGADVLAGGSGADTINGEAGIDTISAAGDVAGVTVHLAGGWGQDGWGTYDTLSGLEDVVGSAFNDTLVGNSVGNGIVGGAGDDWMVGLGGDDLLEGGLGINVMIGGDGVDLASYASQTANLWIDMAAGVYSAAGVWDVFFESIEGALGGSGSDSLFGRTTADVLRGGAGSDILVGHGGADRLEGGEGSDWIVGGDGDDFLVGGANDVDVLTGGAGADLFDVGANAGWDVALDFDTAEDRFSLGGHAWSGFFTYDADGDGQQDDTLLGYAGGNFVALNVTGLTLAQWNALIVAPAGASDEGEMMIAEDDPAPLSMAIAGRSHAADRAFADQDGVRPPIFDVPALTADGWDLFG